MSPIVLILSGFSDFEFAQKAVNTGAGGYLVKPVDEVLLEQKIREFVAMCDEQNQLMDVVQDAETQELHRRFSQMFLFGVVEDAFEDDYIDDNSYQIAIFVSERCGFSEQAGELEKRVKDAFHFQDMFTVLYDNDIVAVFRNCNEQAIIRCLERFAPRISNSAFVVLGKQGHGLQGALDSFLVARKNLSALFFMSGQPFVQTSEIKESDGDRPFNHETFLDKSLFCIETYDAVQLDVLLDEFHQNLYAPTGNPDIVKKQCVAYIVALQNKILSKYPERKFSESAAFDLMPKIINGVDFDSVFQLVKQFTKDFLELFHTNTVNSTVVKVVQYVRNNYSQDLRLELLGDLFNCNSAYLGKRFKEHTGVQFTTYLDQIRIAEAKNMLLSTDLKIYQVSELVGYSNTDYFYMKFRKYTGMTPKEFKQQQKKQEK